ncbi:hypothetical protein CO611_03785 [Lysobacteraceae bacterium NML03-0222]|nr:hypothetical protein CO611_03785 [Xanthomonadaceae bacterium NML03-0222]
MRLLNSHPDCPREQPLRAIAYGHDKKIGGGGRCAANRQEGAALVVVLMLLLVVTVLGLASMRGTLLQERMAGAAYARSIAFNAAETALRQGEAAAAVKPVLPSTGCHLGLCARPLPGNTPVWESATVWTGNQSAEVSLGNEYHGVSARYIVELVGYESGTCDVQLGVESPCPPGAHMYRVTARATSPNGAEVLLQSNYKVQ